MASPNVRVTATEPDVILRSSVAIVRGNDPVVEQLGSGTLIAIADQHFILTAGHVLHEAAKLEAGLGVTAGDGHFVQASGQWRFSIDEKGEEGSRLDVAVYELHPNQVSRFAGMKFVRLADVGVESDLENGYFVLVGYPQGMATRSMSAEEKVELSGVKFATTLHTGQTVGLGGFDPTFHFLLDGRDDRMCDIEGRPVEMPRGMHGVRIPFITGLKGASGAGVWRLHLSKGLPARPNWRFVGVFTGVYEQRAAMKATRLAPILRLFWDMYPSLRPALRLQTPRGST